MNTHGTIAGLLVSLMLSIPAFGQAQSKDQLGQVDFQNSCSPAGQENFQRAVAMLHSFRCAETEKAFHEVLVQDPSCAIATFDQGRKIGAKTQRERDYVEAVAAYYEDWANQPERTRQLNRARAFEALAARYPNDVRDSRADRTCGCLQRHVRCHEVTS